MGPGADSSVAGDWRSYPPLDLPPILRVVLAQIVEHGYDATSVRTIAREVGVTVPALYYHFENKQAMLVALLDHSMDIVSRHVAAALSEADDDPSARLGAMVEAIVLYTVHHNDLAFLDSERRALTEENLRRYVAHRDRVERELHRIIEDGCARGSFRTPIPQECGRAILSMCQGIAGWYDPDGPLSPDETASHYVRLALAMVQSAGHITHGPLVEHRPRPQGRELGGKAPGA